MVVILCVPHVRRAQIADPIAVSRLRNTIKACRALEESDGTSLLVSDNDILEGEKLLGSTESIYAEPAAATPVAGVKEARERGIIAADETVVICTTGFGLKDTESAKQATGNAYCIDPKTEEVNNLYEEAESAAAGD